MIKSYDELPIGLYFKLQALILANPDEEDWKPAAIALLTGKTEAEILAEPLADFSAQMRRAAFLCKAPETELTKASYKAGPFELIPTVDTTKVTTAQYIDFQAFCKEKDDQRRVLGVLSCLLVPKGKKYCDGYEPSDVRDAIRDCMTVTDALSLSAFFLEKLRESMRNTLTFSTRMLEKLKKMPEGPRKAKAVKQAEERLTMLKKQEALLSDGDGWQMLTTFRRLAAVLGMRFGL